MTKRNYVKEIAQILVENDTPITIKEISDKIGISQKNVWNKIHSEEMKNLLKDGIKIVGKTNIGIYLQGTCDNVEELKRRIFTSQGSQNSSLKNAIIIDLLKSSDSVSINDISIKHLISRLNTIKLIDEISEDMRYYNLNLEKRQNAGIIITGNEATIRQYFEKVILDVYSMPNNTEALSTILKIYNLDKYYDKSVDILEKIQKSLGKLTDESKREILIQIIISKYRSSKGMQIKSFDFEAASTAEFQEFCKWFETGGIKMLPNDYIFLWEKSVNNRFTYSNINNVSCDFLNLARNLLTSLIEVPDSEEIDYLVRSLAFHIYQAAKRSRAGILVHNPLIDNIKLRYARFYTMVLTNVMKIEQDYNISLNEDEIGFITVYICAIFEKSLSNKYYKTLLVSNGDIAQTQLLSIRIMRELPNIIIHKSCDSGSLEKADILSCDFIITTCQLSIDTKHKDRVVKITGFLEYEDITAIKKMIAYIDHFNINESIKSSEDDIDFKFFTNRLLDGRDEIISAYIQIAEQFGYVKKGYLDSVIDRENRASTSIGKGLAIPHGDDEYIIKPALFFVKVEHPIKWGNDNVDIVLFLILKFRDIDENKNFFMRLYSCMENTQLIRNVSNINDLNDLKEYLIGGKIN